MFLLFFIFRIYVHFISCFMHISFISLKSSLCFLSCDECYMNRLYLLADQTSLAGKGKNFILKINQIGSLQLIKVTDMQI